LSQIHRSSDKFMNSSDQKCDDFITARVYPILKRSIKRNLCNFKMPTFFYLLLFPLDEMKRKENKHMQVSTLMKEK